MNKNVAALLRIDHAQLTDFGPIVSRHVQQSAIADLTAHLRIEGRPIENDIQLHPIFCPARPDFNDCLASRKS